MKVSSLLNPIRLFRLYGFAYAAKYYYVRTVRPHGLVYRLSLNREMFDAAEYFSGKNVVLIGPNCTLSSELATRVKDADVLAVVNKGYRSRSYLALRVLAREVVLFHCLDQSEKTGGGIIDSWTLRKNGFRSIVYPFYDERFAGNLTRFHCGNYSLLRLRRINPACYAELKTSIEGFTPNTGYAAIWTIAKGNCANLYISGINFFRDAYKTGYHSHLTDLQSAIELIEMYGTHNPDEDLESFRELVKTHNIIVDRALAEILSRPTRRMFYLNCN